jgi:signal recognition particle GTPase
VVIRRLAFDAIDAATTRGADVVIVDTAAGCIPATT